MRLKVKDWDPHTEDDSLVWVLAKIMDRNEGIVEIDAHRDPLVDTQEATRLLGFALFNLNKGKTQAAETLVRKAYVELTGREWD
jgi:hypothetical protein